MEEATNISLVFFLKLMQGHYNVLAHLSIKIYRLAKSTKNLFKELCTENQINSYFSKQNLGVQDPLFSKKKEILGLKKLIKSEIFSFWED